MREPYLRAVPPEGVAARSCPGGEEAEPAGLWHGRQAEVAFDRRRHEVAFLRGRTSQTVVDGMVSSGWELRLTDGPNQMWIRDRCALALGRLDRPVPVPALKRAGPRIA
ncbi:MAG TPA: hypothetical protein VM121_09080 [Acidimicrobiales bacterium]|nr:hypothetical protein [Acidimicrobiales bacterium]